MSSSSSTPLHYPTIVLASVVTYAVLHYFEFNAAVKSSENDASTGASDPGASSTTSNSDHSFAHSDPRGGNDNSNCDKGRGLSLESDSFHDTLTYSCADSSAESVPDREVDSTDSDRAKFYTQGSPPRTFRRGFSCVSRESTINSSYGNGNSTNFGFRSTAGDAADPVDIGHIFGLDVGGTLTKFVYLSRINTDDDHTSGQHSRNASNGSVAGGKYSQAKRGYRKGSGVDVHSSALKRFYEMEGKGKVFSGIGEEDGDLKFWWRAGAGEIRFFRFETRDMSRALSIMKSGGLADNIRTINCTGGGAHKYSSDWYSELGVRMDKKEEMKCLVYGIEFCLRELVGECYTYKTKSYKGAVGKRQHMGAGDDDHDDDYVGGDDGGENGDGGAGSKRTLVDEWNKKVQRDSIINEAAYPYILVSIGTGVSIIRVDGPHGNFERVSGSTIGGGTYWGLCRLLTNVLDFQEVLNLANKGDSNKVDMLVRDIYGDNIEAFEKLGLEGNIVASSFGKLSQKNVPSSGLLPADLARALLMMTTNNIAHVSYLTARLYNTTKIYFVGNFLRNNDISCQRLSYSIDYWSKGCVEALFLEHEGYLGALGAFFIGNNGGVKDDHEDGQSKDDSECHAHEIPVTKARRFTISEAM